MSTKVKIIIISVMLALTLGLILVAVRGYTLYKIQKAKEAKCLTR